MKIKTPAIFSNPFNWRAFIALSIILRGILWLYFGHLVSVNLSLTETIEKYFVRDDWVYFFHPVDNYFTTGHYSYLNNVPFTGRLPGYSIVYFLFRFIFNPHISVFLVIGLQFLLSAISVYVLALTIYYILDKNKRSFYIAYGLYLLAVFPGFFDFFIIAESFSVSAIIFSLYFLTKYIKTEPKTKYLLYSGFFLTWTIFLREYTGLLIVVFPAVLGCYLLFIKKELFWKTVWKTFLFCVPFIVSDGIWATRNYVATGKIILITTPEQYAYSKLYSASWEALDNLVYTWGENASPFDKNTLGYYYRTPKEKIDYKFPPAIFNRVTTYNADSLIRLRELYKEYYFTQDTVKSNQLESIILKKCATYREDYIAHNFFAYWFIKPLKDVKYLIFFSGTGYLPLPAFQQCSVIGKLIKIVFTLLYYTILFTGFAGIILYFFIYRKISVLPLLQLLSFAVMVGTLVYIGTIAEYCSIQEPRYFVQSFALLLLFSAYFADKAISVIKKS